MYGYTRGHDHAYVYIKVWEDGAWVYVHMWAWSPDTPARLSMIALISTYMWGYDCAMYVRTHVGVITVSTQTQAITASAHTQANKRYISADMDSSCSSGKRVTHIDKSVLAQRI